MPTQRWFASLAAVTCALVVGCNSGPAMTDVRGTVELDGKKMSSGKIAFIQQGVPQDLLEVKDGTFEGKAKVGTAKVEVYSYRQGKIPDMYKDTKDKSQFVENVVASTYNSESKLTADIKSGGLNDFKFSAKSK